MNLNETEAKYLAGLLDADGCLSFDTPFNKSNKATLHLRMIIWASESIDKYGYVPNLSSRLEMGRTSNRSFDNPKHSRQHSFIVGSRRDIEVFLPRVIKHMQIKAQEWQQKLELFRESKGKSFSRDEIDTIKKNKYETGPLKHKKHPAWAWVAGYLDGDGCYTNRQYKQDGYSKRQMSICVEADDSALPAINLLEKAFNGSIRYNNRGHLIWKRNLGIKDASFALHFLAKMSNHSKLKKHKIETMIHTLRQRLSDRHSKE
jgi:hypothetical protein